MSSQCQSKTPQRTPGHVCNYSQVMDEELVILTDNSTNTKWEKTAEKAHQQEENEWREREPKVEHKAKCEEAKRQKVEEERLEVEWRKRAEEEEEAQRKKAAEEEAERQRQRASEERAQARWEEATQRPSSMVYNVTTAQRVPGTSVVVTVTRRPPCTCCIVSKTAGQCKPGQGKTRACVPCKNKKKVCSWTKEDAVAGPLWKRAGMGSSQGEKKKKLQGKGKERATEMEEADDEWEAGGEEDEEEPATPHEGPSGVGVSSQWAEWEQEQQLQAMERYVKVHERAMTAFERMAVAAKQMAEAAERTADEWGAYCAWVEWVEMRRRADTCKAMLKHAGGGWKRLQSEVAEDKNEEVDEGVEGDNEEEVEGEQEGGEEQESGREQAMEE
ncbi:hypothetical protein M404DRAFT_31906 [Pisolithus tinctorius Marx 270]|uniref:Uncharacterized protein n=1 Tax=Pisolithus tinctorius Marx 270 TaxID=870435 RepID=A0A0C3JJV5_PISTI|nr:hypothetical protein M404DRAFT_31906 [Pisolithus tinctorius Marx 270]